METLRFKIISLVILAGLLTLLVGCVEDPLEEFQASKNQEYIENKAHADRMQTEAPSLKLAAPTTTPKYCYELTLRSDQNCDGYSNVLMSTIIYDSKEECWDWASFWQMLYNDSETCDEILVRCRTAECNLDE